MKKQYVFGITTVLIWASMATIVKTMLGTIPNLEALSVSSIFAGIFLSGNQMVKSSGGVYFYMRRFR